VADAQTMTITMSRSIAMLAAFILLLKMNAQLAAIAFMVVPNPAHSHAIPTTSSSTSNSVGNPHHNANYFEAHPLKARPTAGTARNPTTTALFYQNYGGRNETSVDGAAGGVGVTCDTKQHQVVDYGSAAAAPTKRGAAPAQGHCQEEQGIPSDTIYGNRELVASTTMITADYERVVQQLKVRNANLLKQSAQLALKMRAMEQELRALKALHHTTTGTSSTKFEQDLRSGTSTTNQEKDTRRSQRRKKRRGQRDRTSGTRYEGTQIAATPSSLIATSTPATTPCTLLPTDPMEIARTCTFSKATLRGERNLLLRARDSAAKFDSINKKKAAAAEQVPILSPVQPGRTLTLRFKPSKLDNRFS
jgi:hypothetical protein